jgi:hypothetical protein
MDVLAFLIMVLLLLAMGRLVLAALAIQKSTREVVDRFKWTTAPYEGLSVEPNFFNAVKASSRCRNFDLGKKFAGQTCGCPQGRCRVPRVLCHTSIGVRGAHSVLI